MNELNGQPRYLWRAIQVVGALLILTWLLFPWRNDDGKERAG
jgi:hypothetical protein